MPENGSIKEPTTGTTGATGTAGTGAATALSQTAHDYGQKISEVASQAKDYVSDKVSVVGDKFKELQNADLGELTEICILQLFEFVADYRNFVGYVVFCLAGSVRDLLTVVMSCL